MKNNHLNLKNPIFTFEDFFDFFKKGIMPNFKTLMENGIYSKNCITDFLAITHPTQSI